MDETVKFVDVVGAEINRSNLHLVIQTLDTLFEFCQGCQGNQVAVFNNHVMETINRVIRSGDFGDAKTYEIAELHNACAQLTSSMLEDSGVKTVKMAQEIDETSDVNAALRVIKKYHASDMATPPRGNMYRGRT